MYKIVQPQDKPPCIQGKNHQDLLLVALLILAFRLLEMNGLYCRVDLTPWNKIKLVRHYYEIIAVDKRLQRVER